MCAGSAVAARLLLTALNTPGSPREHHAALDGTQRAQRGGAARGRRRRRSRRRLRPWARARACVRSPVTEDSLSGPFRLASSSAFYFDVAVHDGRSWHAVVGIGRATDPGYVVAELNRAVDDVGLEWVIQQLTSAQGREV
jgi:hypothetical protein